MRAGLMIITLTMTACAEPPPGAAQSELASGWSIAPKGDLNDFFDCLDETGASLVAAHRGGPAPGYPENATETLERTLSEAPAFIEVDVATSADGVLYLMHDDTLDRTTTGEGAIDGLPWADIARLRLEDGAGRPTAFHPPRLSDVLAWAEGRTILEIDIKRSTRYAAVAAEIDRQDAEDRVILIAYSRAQAEKLHRLMPAAMISLPLGGGSDLNRAVAAGLPAERLLGFTGTEASDSRLNSTLESEDIEVIFATLGGDGSIDNRIAASGDDGFYAELAETGVDIIATDRPAAAQAALDAAGRGAKAGECGVGRRNHKERQ